MTLEVSNFEVDVIEASRERPVLVDFWAPWCGPCRMLGPVLEKLADENREAWTLVKLNTDAIPTVAARYRISSIPAVKLFVDGEVKDEFIGALPEPQVRDWLAKAIPNETSRQIEAAQAALDAGDSDTAETLLRAVLAKEPDEPRAAILLARLRAFRDPDEAERLAATDGDVDATLFQTREAVRTVARLRHLDLEALPEAPVRDVYADAIEALRRHDVDAALAGFVKALSLDRRYDDDGARRAGIAIFKLLGDGHPVAKKHRTAFDMALF